MSTNDRRAEMIERVRKLLALADSPNEHEARAAVAKAAELMDRFRIEESELHGADEGWTTQRVEAIARDPFGDETYHVAAAVDLIFHTRTIFTHRGRRLAQLTVFGRPDHVAIGVYALAVLRRTARRLWRDYRRARPQHVGLHKDFYFGFAQGLIIAADLQRRAATASASFAVARLDADREVEAAFAAAYPAMEALSEPSVGRSKQVQAVGRRLGLTTTVAPAVAAGDDRTAAIPLPPARQRQGDLFGDDGCPVH